ncbi:uncharacterized protein [Pyxicephalus adspersus]|uniref:uncharacterized protein n=1 Tax=Pyxicephalus adspersus TaxID=30357 RepID=UPI003B5A5851
MDPALKSLLLLALCTLAKTEQNIVLEEQKALVETKDLSPKYRTIKLNITICVPKHGNNDTKITMANQQINPTSLYFTAGAERTGPKTPCNVTSCIQDKLPELAVFIFQEGLEKHLICSTNLTNENLNLMINASTSDIAIIPKKTPGILNSVSVVVKIVAKQIENFKFTQSDSLASVAVTLEQTCIPTTTLPTTKSVSSPTTEVTTTLNKPQETTKKPLVTSPNAKPTTEQPPVGPVTSKGSSLVRGALWGMVLLVMIQIFLN